MNSISQVNSGTVPKFNDGEILADLQKRAAKIQKLTEVEQINLENEWTEFIKNLVDYGNTHYLRNYSLWLEMEERLGGR